MDTYPLIVIGSGPGGVNAATAYLESGGHGPVLILTSDEDPPYMRPPLSKESLRSSDEPEPTPLADDLGQVELRLGATVSRMDPDARTVQAGTETPGFEQLVIATGAAPMSLPGVGTQVEQHQMRGLEVTIATREQAPQQERLGEHASAAITGWLCDLGVRLHTGVDVSSVDPPRTVRLSDGTTLEPDLLLVVVGVEPATDCLERSGLELEQGRVVVDAHLQTSVAGVYAVGDVALAQHPVVGRPVPVEHWGDAEAMGQIAGRGRRSPASGARSASTR